MASSSLLTTLLLLLVGILLARLTASRLERWAVPAIVLELVVGFVLGNTLLPYAAIRPLAGLTELGVLTLFFQVGLEVRGDLLQSRRGAVLRTVALSALTPLLAWGPLQAGFQLSGATTLLCLAVLSATGTGVTLRLLAQRQALGTPSGRLLVGVSVLDDLPAIGLLSLAMAQGSAQARAAGQAAFQSPGLAGLLLGLGLAALSYWGVERWRSRQSPRQPDLLTILLLLISCAWVGEASGLTSLLGALWAGVLLGRLLPQGPDSSEEQRLRGQLTLLSEVFLPLYFLSVGMRVSAATLLNPAAWGLAAVLTVLALLCKAVCGLGVRSGDRAAGVDPQVVVYGLIPRGLPGLVFATSALAAGLIDAVQFSALVLMVTVTTVLGLVLLGRRLRQLEAATAPTSSP
ncbi:cation:proton antiporter [Vulcanococcus limneticus]|uniref:cation:proton antiporter n=1 Tax=Vulcanococcus limneticus TaxID=2170428 RepID=UPI00398BF215